MVMIVGVGWIPRNREFLYFDRNEKGRKGPSGDMLSSCSSLMEVNRWGFLDLTFAIRNNVGLSILNRRFNGKLCPLWQLEQRRRSCSTIATAVWIRWRFLQVILKDSTILWPSSCCQLVVWFWQIVSCSLYVESTKSNIESFLNVE